MKLTRTKPSVVRRKPDLTLRRVRSAISDTVMSIASRDIRAVYMTAALDLFAIRDYLAELMLATEVVASFGARTGRPTYEFRPRLR